MTESRTAEIRRLARSDEERSRSLLAALLRDLFGLTVENVRFNHDQYSLNSLNGFFDADGKAYFFKFHQEEGEEEMSGEYYRADILAKAGLPVDQPVHMSVQPGEQILIYRRRTDPRFSDVLRALDLAPDPSGETLAFDAERGLSVRLLDVMRETLHPVAPEAVAEEPIHRLFYERLIDPRSQALPGGRYESFYIGQTFRFPGVTLEWDDFSRRRFVVNGRRYKRSVGELFEAAAARLNPRRLADAGGVTAHGDAHNANVWYSLQDGRPELSFFDPAFAGRDVPSLLAEVKSTVHNIFAHPMWLYDPGEARKHYSAVARLEPGLLIVDTDWDLTSVRRGLLKVKAETLWRPFLAELKSKGLLPADWRDVIRLALFLCPTLVMNLRAKATSHTEISSAIGFSVAVMVGSEPEEGEDHVSAFLDAIDPDQPQ